MNRKERVGFGFGIIWRVMMEFVHDFEHGAYHGYSMDFLDSDGDDDDDDIQFIPEDDPHQH